MDYYLEKVEGVLTELKSSKEGLSEADAKSRIEQYGLNEITKQREISAFEIFISQFKNILVWILILALAISASLGEWVDAIVVGIIIVINAVLGFVQEFRAEKSIEALQKLTSPKAVVLRGGHETKIDANQVVPGDILVLQVGDKIPADARIIELSNLETQEAALTGESTPVVKQADPMKKKIGVADRINLVYAGTIVTKGHGLAVVTNTAMQTEIGKIAGLIQKAPAKKTPLQEKLDHFGKILGGLVLLICLVVFLAGIIRGFDTLEMFFAAVSLAVAAVPEGLPAVVTITLALGVQRMVRKNALIRNLPSVETLGCTTVICTDKTGTLTKNEMTVTKVYVDGEVVEISGSGYGFEGKFSSKPKSLEKLFTIGVMCNDAQIDKKGKKVEVIGDPTEASLLVSAKKFGIDFDKFRKKYTRKDEIPFDSERKLMSTINQVDRKKIIYTKGAPDQLLKKCSKILDRGRERAISQKDRREILKINEKFASEALRILGFAYKDAKYGEKETSLVFVGLQAMIDPPRPEAMDAVQKCNKAGIRVVMVTGDHAATAEAIANKLGIEGDVITGDEIKEKELHKYVDKIAIYARVNPKHKSMIVEALKKKGHVVAMTGDGVNDAPSLKHADIGVSMGITGTEVAKEASAMIITDDNFASVVNAVEEGRTIYDNIQKFVEFLLSCNIGEVLTIFFGILLGLPLPLIAIQILWMNLITDGLPALALGIDPEEPGVMNRPPRKTKEEIVSGKRLMRMFILGAVMMFGTLGVFVMYRDNLDLARTMAFTTLVLFQMFHVFNCRSLDKSLFKVGVFKNGWLIMAVGTSLLLQLLVVYSPLNKFFKTIPLTLGHLGIAVLVASSIFVVREIWKMFARANNG